MIASTSAWVEILWRLQTMPKVEMQSRRVAKTLSPVPTARGNSPSPSLLWTGRRSFRDTSRFFTGSMPTWHEAWVNCSYPRFEVASRLLYSTIGDSSYEADEFWFDFWVDSESLSEMLSAPEDADELGAGGWEISCPYCFNISRITLSTTSLYSCCSLSLGDPQTLRLRRSSVSGLCSFLEWWQAGIRGDARDSEWWNPEWS